MQKPTWTAGTDTCCFCTNSIDSRIKATIVVRYGAAARPDAPGATAHPHLGRRPPDRAARPVRGPHARALADRAPRDRRGRRRHQLWDYEDRDVPADRAQRGRRAAQRRVVHGAARASTRCGAAAGTSTPASPTWTSTASAASLCFPSLIAGFAGTVFCEERRPRARPRLRAGLERLAPRGVGRRRTPTGSSRCSCRGCATRSSRPTRSAATPSAASRPCRFPENPRRPRAAVAAHRPLGPVPARVRGDRHRRLPAQRVRAVDRGPLAGRAARALHDAVPGQRAGRGRATGCGPASRCGSRSSTSRSPRAASAGCRCSIDRIDYVLDHSAIGLEGGWDDPTCSPTEVLRRNFWFCTIDDPSTFGAARRTSASTTS